jgi:hypothetical protein
MKLQLFEDFSHGFIQNKGVGLSNLDLTQKSNNMTTVELLLQVLSIITNPMDTGAGKTKP